MSSKKLILLISIVLIFLIMVFIILNLRLRETELKDSNNQFKKSESVDVNRKFLDTFFTYKSTKDRYEEIKPLMTNNGYKLSYPSGNEIPTTTQSVKSKLSKLVSFEHQISKFETEFYNQFVLETLFNEIGSTRKTLIYTKLIFVEGEWLVDDLEYITDLGDQ